MRLLTEQELTDLITTNSESTPRSVTLEQNKIYMVINDKLRPPFGACPQLDNHKKG